jgi:hypothetical protein
MSIRTEVATEELYFQRYNAAKYVSKALHDCPCENLKFYNVTIYCSSVGTVMGYGVGRKGSTFGKAFLFSTESRPAPGPTQPSIHSLPAAISLRIKVAGARRSALISF